MDTKELKQLQRLKMQKFRNSITPAKIEQASNSVIQNCINGLDWKSIKSIQVYLPIASNKEINTWPLLKHLWQSYPHIKTAVPVIRNGRLYSAAIREDTVFRPARFGTLEPLHPSLLPGNHKFDIVIVPALGFDRRGHRLGYGKGFYDKFLSTFTGISMGFAYAKSEITPDLPNEEHDIALNYIATEQELVCIS